MASEPVKIADLIQLGEDFELDLRGYELRRSGRPVKLERIPMELLLLLVQERGQLVTRDEIIARIWGKDVFVDSDNSINAAIRKIRQVLKDDPDRPRFIQTITGKGYRFIAPVIAINPVPPVQDVPRGSEAGAHSSGSPENLIGRKVAHYRILQLLGGGGMGIVYRAEDLRLGRSVAIKFLPDEVGNDSPALNRMRREARVASALEHPNVCPIYELGEHEGRPFIVMQLLEGQTLREWIGHATDQASAYCVNQIVNYGIQICRGLEAAHEKGIIHRDIKPANIFITTRSEVKILDFGVAKLRESTAPEATKAGRATTPEKPEREGTQQAYDMASTQTGDSVGTPSYLSPEQVRREPLDARTDLFSFGLVLYEMATGQRAFSGNTASAIQDAVLHLPATSVRALRPSLPPELESVINRAIEKDRERRYQTGTELRADLERVPIPADPATVIPGASSSAKPLAIARTSRNKRRVLAFALVLLAAVSGLWWYRTRAARELTPSDTIVISNFSNSTGDSIFDDTLKQGLDVALRQSPFLSIVSDDKVSSTLKLMTRPPGTPLTAGVAREVCQRVGSKAYVEGAIAALGSDYVIGLKAVNCNTGDLLAGQQITATSKEKVIPALGKAAAALRGELGESLGTVQQYDVPLPQATTSSLEALKAFSMAISQAEKGRYDDAIPFYKHAIELDPDFAAAYAHLGQAYANSGQDDLASASIKQAFERQTRASEPEKFYIVTRYHELVSGDVEKRIDALRLWKQMYPRDDIPPNDLAAEYTDMGNYGQGLEEALQEVQLSPNEHTGYELLGMAYLGLNRFAEAKAVRQKEIALKVDYHWDHVDLYGIAVQEQDAAGMQREIEWARGNKQEFHMLLSAAGYLAASGKLNEADATVRQAMEKAQASGAADAARSMRIDVALIHTLVGNSPEIPQNLSALAGSNQTGLTNAGRLSALVGKVREATSIANALAQQYPHDSYVNNVWVPSIRAEAEISNGNPLKGIELLEPARRYEFGWRTQFWPNYVRGRAYLGAGKGAEAAAEFQKILDHRGVSLASSLSPLIYSLSQLELARAKALSGDRSGAAVAYQQFISMLKDADPDLPILKQARAELGKLQ